MKFDNLLLRDALDLVEPGVAILQRRANDWCFTYINAAHLAQFGFRSESDLLGRSWRSLYKQESIVAIETHAMPLLGRQGTWHGELPIVTHAGNRLQQCVTLQKLSPDTLFCVSTLIAPPTGVMRERALAGTELPADVPAVVVSPEGDILAANDEVGVLFGYAPAELRSFTLADLAPYLQPSDLANTGVGCFAVLARRVEGTLLTVHAHWERLPGGELCIRFTLPDASAPDAPTATTLRAMMDALPAALYDDLREQLRVERTLRGADLRYRTIFESAGFGIGIADADGRIISANPALARMLGRAPEEVRGCYFGSFVHEEDLPREVEAYIALLRDEGGSYNHETRLVRSDGGVVLTDITVTALKSESGALAALAVFQDITSRRELEDLLFHSQKMDAVGKLAGGVAHDFNNILTVIQGGLEHLLDDLDASDPRREDVLEMHRSALRATGVTRQLLALSRRQVLQPRAVDLRDITSGMQEMIRRLVPTSISVELQLADEPAIVIADPVQIEQVVLNLAVNARDAMTDGGRLTVAVEHDTDERYVVLRVSDTGTGIPEALIPRIFEPFMTTKNPGEGTGLGLATVYGIVQQSGGLVQVNSTVNVGSVFTVHLPRCAEPPEQPIKPGITRSFAHQGGTILLVEDEDALRKLLERMLARAGYTVICAADGEEALQHVQRHTPCIDLLLTDLVMPRMGGNRLAELLRQQQPELAVLIMSGYAEESVLGKEGLSSQFHFIEKPFSRESLLERVGAILSSAPVLWPVSREIQL